MGRIILHTQEDECRVSGAIRSKVQTLSASMSANLFEFYVKDVDFIKNHHPSDYRKAYFFFADYMGGNKVKVGDEYVHASSIALNTLLDLGNDFIRLATYIHGYCENHCYVLNENKQWLHETIQKGLDAGFFDESWTNAVQFIKESGELDIVFSYSVCNTFPNSYATKWVVPEGDEDHDAWYELSQEEQWQLSMDYIKDAGEWFNLSSRLDARFGWLTTVFDLIEQVKGEKS